MLVGYKDTAAGKVPAWLDLSRAATSQAARHPEHQQSSAVQSIIRFARTMLHFYICATKLFECSWKN